MLLYSIALSLISLLSLEILKFYETIINKTKHEVMIDPNFHYSV